MVYLLQPDVKEERDRIEAKNPTPKIPLVSPCSNPFVKCSSGALLGSSHLFEPHVDYFFFFAIYGRFEMWEGHGGLAAC